MTLMLKRENFKMVGKLGVIVLGMFCFGYALVPIYKAICEMTGINVLALGDRQIPGATANLPANTQVDLARTITVEFDANSRGPWHFKPAKSSLQVHPGELTTVMYEVVNTQARTVQAQAIPSYAPQSAMPYFKKVDCFCFKQQTLKPNEARQMPVVFFIDPKIPRQVSQITLSYTFFEIAGTDKVALQ